MADLDVSLARQHFARSGAFALEHGLISEDVIHEHSHWALFDARDSLSISQNLEPRVQLQARSCAQKQLALGGPVTFDHFSHLREASATWLCMVGVYHGRLVAIGKLDGQISSKFALQLTN